MDRDSTGFTDAQGTPIHEADVVKGPMPGTGKIVFRAGRFWVEFRGGAVALAEDVAGQLEVIGHGSDDAGE